MRHAIVVLLITWALTTWTSTGGGGGPDNVFPTEGACVAAANREVTIGKANKAKAEAVAAAFARAHNLDPNQSTSWTDYDVKVGMR